MGSVLYLVVLHVEVDGVWRQMGRKTGQTQTSADHVHVVPGHVFLAELDSFICNFTVAQLGTCGRGFLEVDNVDTLV